MNTVYQYATDAFKGDSKVSNIASAATPKAIVAPAVEIPVAEPGNQALSGSLASPSNSPLIW